MKTKKFTLAAAFGLIALVAPRAVRADSTVYFSMTLTYNGLNACGPSNTSLCSETSAISFEWDNTTNAYVSGSATVTGSGVLGSMTLYSPPSYGTLNGQPIVSLITSDAAGDLVYVTITESAGGLPLGSYTSTASTTSPLPAMTVQAVLVCGSSGDTCEFDYTGSASGAVPIIQAAAFGTGAGTVNPVGVNPPPHWLGFNQILRLIVAGPITPAPGTPVEATVGFVDLNGNAIGPAPTTLTINPGQFVSVDFPANEYIKTVGPRIAVVPVLTILPNPNAVPGNPPGNVQASIEVFDAILALGTLFNPVPSFPPSSCVALSCSSNPPLVPQGLAGGQSLRITAVAYPPTPCVATLSFADNNDNPLGGSDPVNLQPGTGTYFDLNAATLGLSAGQRADVLPIVTLTPPIAAAAGPPMGSACQVSVEAFDHLTGRTATYQSALLQ